MFSEKKKYSISSIQFGSIKQQPKKNFLYFKIYKSLRYHFLRDLQLVNISSSAKISKPTIELNFILRSLKTGNFQYPQIVYY